MITVGREREREIMFKLLRYMHMNTNMNMNIHYNMHVYMYSYGGRANGHPTICLSSLDTSLGILKPVQKQNIWKTVKVSVSEEIEC